MKKKEETKSVHFKMTADQVKLLKHLSHQSGLSVSKYIRMKTLNEIHYNK
jgi:hypothetical protein